MSAKPAPRTSSHGATSVAKREPSQPLAGRCNAKYKDGNYCHRHPLKNRKRCARHGGRQGTGPANSHWKGGVSGSWLRRNLPAHLIKKFDVIVNDPDLISLRSMLALNGVRLGELMEKLPTGENRNLLLRISGLLSQQSRMLMTLRATPGLSDTRTKEIDDAVKQIESGLAWVEQASKTSALWDEITLAMDSHRKLADTERRREEALQQHITMPQAVALFTGLYSLISKTVRDEGERIALADGMRKLLEHGPERSAEDAEMVS